MVWITKEKTTSIRASLTIPLGELAIYILKRGEDNSALLHLLSNYPERVNGKMAEKVKKYLQEQKLKVRLMKLEFAYNDSDKFSHGASYFDVILRGTEKELRKATEEDFLFVYDWEGIESKIKSK